MIILNKTNMKKLLGVLLTITCLIFVIVVAIGVLGFFEFKAAPRVTTETKSSFIPEATYNIGGEEVILRNGVAEKEIMPGAASKIITRYFGNDLAIDLDKNGQMDSVFIVTQETGGSGIFYYVTALLNNQIGLTGIFLGDRIAPQSTDLEEGDIIAVNYADRADGESFEGPPSIGKTLRLQFDPTTNQFKEVAIGSSVDIK